MPSGGNSTCKDPQAGRPGPSQVPDAAPRGGEQPGAGQRPRSGIEPLLNLEGGVKPLKSFK